MNGLELSRAYYEAFGKEMIHNDFPALEGIVAVGLVGEGSECFGFDDEVSRDHDFGPRFCLFLPDSETLVSSRLEFQLERAYAKLPREFEGFVREKTSPVGGARDGVMRIGAFYEKFIGAPSAPEYLIDWLNIPEHFLATATNGAVFRDDEGTFSRIRQSLSQYPEDVWKKKLAAVLLQMNKSGQYNYRRCLQHGETCAAQLCVTEFCRAARRAAFLFNHTFEPYYKWAHRAMRALPKFSDFSETIEFLLTSPNDEDLADIKSDTMETIAISYIEELQRRGLTRAVCTDLEKHAYSLNDTIADPDLRNLNLFFALD